VSQGEEKDMTRTRNPYASRYTLDQFKVRYFGSDNVNHRIASAFWSDFNYAFHGGLQRYIKETTEVSS
jgi:hypothetical protein